MTASGFSAIVLAGGQSRRMGTDKALLRLPSGGLTLVERVIAAATSVGADEVLVVGGERGRFPVGHARLVPDAHPGAGPLEGLATGLTAARHDLALALACDLPYLSIALLRWMLAQPRADWDALVPLLLGADGKDGWQPLHALYTRDCLPPIRAALAAGERRMTAIFPSLRVRALTGDEMRPHDPALRSTESVNSPETWAEAARWLAATDTAILPAQE